MFIIMRKSILVSLALTASLFAGVGATSTTANAASWHKGMPKALQGTWKTKYSKAFGTSFKLKIGKNYAHAQGLDPDYLNNTHYRYLGHHEYKVNGYEPIYSKKTRTHYYKWISKHHIVVRGTGYYR